MEFFLASARDGFLCKSSCYWKASECVTIWFLQQPADKAILEEKFRAVLILEEPVLPFRGIVSLSSLHSLQKMKELRIL